MYVNVHTKSIYWDILDDKNKLFQTGVKLIKHLKNFTIHYKLRKNALHFDANWLKFLCSVKKRNCDSETAAVSYSIYGVE